MAELQRPRKTTGLVTGLFISPIWGTLRWLETNRCRSVGLWLKFNGNIYGLCSRLSAAKDWQKPRGKSLCTSKVGHKFNISIIPIKEITSFSALKPAWDIIKFRTLRRELETHKKRYISVSFFLYFMCTFYILSSLQFNWFSSNGQKKTNTVFECARENNWWMCVWILISSLIITIPLIPLSPWISQPSQPAPVLQFWDYKRVILFIFFPLSETHTLRC